MLLAIFTFLYELLAGENHDYPEFREQIFNSVGTLTLFISACIALLFYIVLGRWKMIWYNTVHWVITLVFCCLIGIVLALTLSNLELGLMDGYVIRFSLFNGFYAMLFFILFSFLLKNFSIFSKHTPI